jgi:glycolate oxidase iron-sulfur subunit
VCPTYQLWGEEMDSPRGRIHLMTQVLDGAPLSAATAGHLDRCLGCMACVPACPSGVHYDRLIEAARTWVEDPAARPEQESGPGPDETGARADGEPGGAAGRPAQDAGDRRAQEPGYRRTLRERAARAAIFAVFPYPRRLRLLTGPLRAAQRTGLDELVRRSSLPGRVSPELEAALRLAPPRPGHRVPPLPALVAARGPRRAVAGMLTGCVQGVFFPQVNTATARVLAAEGCDVLIPNGQGCCGALSLHSGRRSEALRLAKRTIATFEAADVDAIVINSAGCGSAMKEYGLLLADDPAWAARAAALAARVRDFAEFLAELTGAGNGAAAAGAAQGAGARGARGGAAGAGAGGQLAQRHPLPVTAVYHDACHLGHAQGIKAQPRALLRAIPGLEIAETGDGGVCCGSAGVYNLLQPEAARELGARKAATIRATGAQLLISANPGCSLQIATALAAQGVSMPVAHTAQVLDASIRGLPVSSLTRTAR